MVPPVHQLGYWLFLSSVLRPQFEASPELWHPRDITGNLSDTVQEEGGARRMNLGKRLMQITEGLAAVKGWQAQWASRKGTRDGVCLLGTM